MSDREALLKRWSELAPGECVLVLQAEGHHTLATATHDEWHTADSPIFRAILLSALIEAIRARGWYSVVWNDDEAFAHVKKADSELLGKAASHEPCDALLSAYCAALESLQEAK